MCMCNFNNRLFTLVLVVFVIINNASGKPNNRGRIFLDYGDNSDRSYDLHYDQRQNGSENYRVNLNGVLVAIPVEQVKDNADDFLTVIYDEIIGLSPPADHHSEIDANETSYEFEKNDALFHHQTSELLDTTTIRDQIANNKDDEILSKSSNKHPKSKLRFINLLKLLRGSFGN